MVCRIMATLRPFCALRPSATRAAEVASLPYDVVTEEKAREIVKLQPWNFLRVSRSEVDLPQGEKNSSKIFEQAVINFNRFIREVPFLREDRPSLYIYRLQEGDHVQTGIVGSFAVDDYDSNVIKKHERTRVDKEEDRTEHTLKLSAHTGPVFLLYPDAPSLDHAIAEVIKQTPPLYRFRPENGHESTDGIWHTIWRIDPQELTALATTHFEKNVPSLYIADGHHRAAAASRVRSRLAQQNKNHSGDEEYNFFLAIAFPFSQVRVLPYHRLVKDLNQLSVKKFLERVEMEFKIGASDRTMPKSGEFGMFLGQNWYLLTPKESPQEGSYQGLDVDILQNRLLAPILGIQDPRMSPRIDFLGGTTDPSDLEQPVLSRSAAVAFTVSATPLQTIIQVADKNGIMPPKSTWFSPKPRDGLLSHTF